MPSQRALVTKGPGKAEVVTDHPVPTPRDDFILVKNVAVALNPTDHNHIDEGVPGTLAGCDYAGYVEKVGKAVTADLKPGDRVYGGVHGSNVYRPENGTFAEYIVAKGDLQCKIPPGLSFEEAATLPTGILTLAQGLYQYLGLALPTEPIKDKTPILIYGGSSATGSLAIQFAKLSGYEVITVCSRANFDFVQGLGADAVFDYHDPECGSEIREYTHNKLKLVWDTISVPSSAKICADALSSTPGGLKYYTLLTVDCPRDDIECKFTMEYYMFGEAFQMGRDEPVEQPDIESYEFAKSFVHMANALIAEDKIRTHPPRVGRDGLKGIPEGLKLMKEGKVRAAKLVYRIADTPS